jgi:hypothetical protein
MPVRWYRDANALLAVAGTVAIVALHFYFLARVGGLWRDEVNSVNLAQGSLHDIFRDSFPILFPMLLRGWSAIGLGGSDVAVRLLGVFMGLALVTVFWVAAWWTRRTPPFWSLVFMALNAWVIYFSASLRAYGLGSAMVALCAAAAWRFTAAPDRKTWAVFALTAVLCVQTLYQNCVFVAAICAGACAVFLCQKRFKPCIGVFLAGLTGAISMLPYAQNIMGMPQGASPLRIDFDDRIALSDLDTLIAYPLPPFFWLWPVLSIVVLICAIMGLMRGSRDYRAVFAAVAIGTGAVTFWMFLRMANFPVQPWYFLPLVALTAVCVDAALPRPAGKFRAAVFGLVAATAGISAVFGIRVLDYRFTNVDKFARKISAAADRNDLVIVAPWEYGITFSRYFQGPCAWTTVPPLADHRVHRFDLIQKEMAEPEVMRPVLDQVEATLKAGNAVWFVGGINRVMGTNAPGPMPPPPLPHTGWHETPYVIRWNDQLGWLVRQNATNIEVLDKGDEDDVSLYERENLEKVTGWKR